MQTTSLSVSEALKDSISRAYEVREPAQEEIDRATTRFVAQMEHLEQRALAEHANPDEIIISLTKAVMDMGAAAAEYERSVAGDKALVQEGRIKLRQKTRRFFEQSYFNRGREWPLGHPGDHHMIEFLYRNTPLSRNIGYYLDRYFLATTLSVAVRERKETLRELIKTELDSRRQPKVLDVACGSCREVFELAREIESSGALFTCIDFDNDALTFAADRMAHAGAAAEQVAYRKYNALKMINHERNLKEFGMQDVIYSVGFFDYLDDDVLVRLLNSLFTLLKPGGSLITSFKDCRRYRTFDTSWMLNWDAFYQRTEEDMRDILDRAGIPRTALTMTREKSGVIVFFTAAK